MSIVNNLLNAFQGVSFTLAEAYQVNPDVNSDSVRARIYENLGTKFEKVGRALYVAKNNDCIVLEGDGRDLSILKDESVDCIITDHPWENTVSNKGGNRNFAEYDCFKYTLEDFKEKARVLKTGSFLCEVLPAENENNFDYLYQVKKMAQEAGFQYYAKITWRKGSFVSNTGRKAKNSEDLMIFSKGKARALRPDKQRGVDEFGNPTRFMSGASGMFPAEFLMPEELPEVINVQAVPRSQQICQSEKPVALFEELIQFLTKEGEIVLDQFAGSGSVGRACHNTKRKCILIEKVLAKVKGIARRLDCTQLTNTIVRDFVF